VNETIRKHLQLIEWARLKNDLGSCGELAPTVLDERTAPDGKRLETPSHGDFLAYCLARVTRNPDRCAQIAPDTSPPLRALCESEFIGNT